MVAKGWIEVKFDDPYVCKLGSGVGSELEMLGPSCMVGFIAIAGKEICEGQGRHRRSTEKGEIDDAA